MKKCFKVFSILLFSTGYLLITSGVQAGSDPGVCMDDRSSNGKKANICHVPSGNPSNAHTISVSVNALGAHVGSSAEGLHGGDACGACVVSTLDPCDQSSSLDGCISDGIYY